MRIALFPLRTVLFPHGLLPLRIFETRYVDMIRRVMREDAGFGVVLIRAGAETGDVDAVAQVGTLARIVDFGQMPDGLLQIMARGGKRFRILGRARQADGLHLADVEWLDDPVEAPLRPDEFPGLKTALADALAQLRQEYPAGEAMMQDAQWVAGHLCQLMPAPAQVRQQLLEAAGARQRLAAIEQMSR